MEDPFDLQRFVMAQNPVFDQVLAELASGKKTSHWMWFVFPQIEGLGSSPTARHFAIRSLSEAQAYLRHPLLGPRLEISTQLVNDVAGRSAHAIFGSPDDVKFRSSMTLFSRAAAQPKIFEAALLKYFDGKPDEATIARSQKC